jgi:hypothetical protein
LTPERFIVGVNYWPQKLGFDLWKHFDVDEVQEDFARLSDLGIDYARVFLLWEDFQPKAESVRCAALAHLLELCDAAAAENLKLELMLMSGHLGNVNRVPPWMLDDECTETPRFPTMVNGEAVPLNISDPFTDPRALRATLLFASAVARAVGGHAALSAYNLGNQPDRLSVRPTVATAHPWFSNLKQAIAELDPHHPVTCSLGSSHLISNTGLRVDRVFETLDFCTIENDGLGALEIGKKRAQRTRFNCALTTALTNKPTMVQEWSPGAIRGPTDERPNDVEVANYVETLLPQLVAQGARGAILYGFADPPATSSSSFHAGHYGLFDENGRLKPYGKALSQFARTKPRTVPLPNHPLTFNLSPEQFYLDPNAYVQGLFEGFVHA